MSVNKRTQKQVAERLKGNLDYYNRPHPWRTLRFTVSALTLLLGLAAVPAYYYARAPENFVNPGPISRAHAPIANDCRTCHPNTDLIKADTHRAGDIVRAEYFAPIDKACADCHKHFEFHVPNTVPDRTRPAHVAGAQTEQSSCTGCHREHLTAGRMVSTASENCAGCHARADLMNASAGAGRAIPANHFPTTVHPKGGESLLYFPKARPLEGYTKTFVAFDNGHPAFQTETAKETGPFDTLRYNHHLHDQGKVLFDEQGNRRVPDTEKGNRLSCAYCHKPDPTGIGFTRITFDTNCAACHNVKFDPYNPELVIPHGDPEKVRSFLRSLDGGIRYRDLARARGMNDAMSNQFAVEAMNRLKERVLNGENFERQVFFNKDWVSGASTSASGGPNISRYLPGAAEKANAAATLAGTRGALFPGCALCHQVSPAPNNAAPKIAPCPIPDRWFVQGKFNHAKHIGDGKTPSLTCVGCHASIAKSELTSEVNLPTQRSCTECHNAKPGSATEPAGVLNNCTDCHHFHNDPRAATPPFQPRRTSPPFKRADATTPPLTGHLSAMMLGR